MLWLSICFVIMIRYVTRTVSVTSCCSPLRYSAGKPLGEIYIYIYIYIHIHVYIYIYIYI